MTRRFAKEGRKHSPGELSALPDDELLRLYDEQVGNIPAVGERAHDAQGQADEVWNAYGYLESADDRNPVLPSLNAQVDVFDRRAESRANKLKGLNKDIGRILEELQRRGLR